MIWLARLGLLTRRQDVADEDPNCPGLSALLPVAVVANSGCCCWMLVDVEPGLIHFLRRHHFHFLYKNNIVPSMVLTAHEIPLTVFLPSPAYFYSFGYFILRICWACFGRGKIYCFISGCTFIYFKQTQEDLILGSGLLPAVFAQNCGGPHSPRQG